jgi:NitT/TauT family transport system ATP-binding protein
VAAPAVELRGVSHRFRGDPPVDVLDGVTLIVNRGQFVSLVGPSGCGKSTLLRMLAGLVAPDAGVVEVDGAPAVGHAGLVAFMPQRDLLLPWRRALANATLGAQVAGMPADEARRRAEALFERFGLAGFERAWPGQLSGGMRQRLALLRTFLMPRDTLLLDEPFGALDAITRRDMHGWLQDVWRRDRRSVLFVTHDVEEALVLSDVVYVLSARPGRVVDRLDVPLERPRAVATTTTPEFAALKARLLDALERGRA